ncbi:MAG: UvrD-helicase domain-containing protein [Armatimonadota bacterium]
MPLDPTQVAVAQAEQDAAAHDAGPRVRLIAGPGTGKSKTIEERVRWLLEQGAEPDSLFVISFTRASARDLARRVCEHCTGEVAEAAQRVSVTTLHSMALRVLSAAGELTAFPSDPMVLSEWELDNIIDSEFAHSCGRTPARCKEVRRQFEAHCDTGHWDPPGYVPPTPPISEEERTGFVHFHTPRTLVYSCVMPGEIIRRCVEGIEAGTLEPAELLNIQHLVIDEFQDLNPCDLSFVAHLVGAEIPTFIAGDDDQSVYSFRYASPRGIQQFPDQHDPCSCHNLVGCFRCPPEILASATALIESFPIPNRVPKELHSLHASADPPVSGQVMRWRFANGAREAAAIAASCRSLIDADFPPEQIVVLISNRKALQPAMTSALDHIGIEYELAGSEGYTEDRDGRMALSLLRIVCKHGDYVALRTLLGCLPRVGVGTCCSIADDVTTHNLRFSEVFFQPLPADVFHGRSLTALGRAATLVQEVATWAPADMLEDRTERVGQILHSLYGDDARERWRDAVESLPDAATLEEVRDFLWSETLVQQDGVRQRSYERLGLPIEDHAEACNRVRIMTMHSSKGLSGGVVFVPGLEDEIIPGSRRIPYPGLVLEAARLLYVSMTRARAALVMSYAQNRYYYGADQGQHRSRFLNHTNGHFDGGPLDGISPGQVDAILDDWHILNA